MVVPPCTLDTSEAKGVYQSTFRLLNLRGVDFASSIPFDRGSRPTEMDSLDRPNGVCDFLANHKRRVFQQQGFPGISSLSVEHHYSRRQFTRSRPILRRQKRSLDRHCSQNSPPLHWTSFQVRNWYCMCWASQHDALHLVILRLPFISGDVILFDRRQIHVRRDGHDSRSLGRRIRRRASYGDYANITIPIKKESKILMANRPIGEN